MKKDRPWVLGIVVSLVPILWSCFRTQAQSPPTAPVYKIVPVLSKITFQVKASIPIEGIFENWNATLAFSSTDASSGVLDVKIRADSVNTGSKWKDDRLKGEECFDVKKYPYLTFRSTKIIPMGSHRFEVPGTVTIRGVAKAEALTFTADREGPGTGEIEGTLWFDRRDFGLDGGIPFVRIADRVQLTVDFKAIRASGPPLLFKQ